MLKIPKGHYEIQFVSGSENPFSTKNLFGLFKKRLAVILIAILCCLILVIWFHYHSIERKLASYQVINQNDPIWQDYFQSDLPILIVIGDHFFYNDFSEKYKQTITIRNPKVNSIEDFRTLYPDLRVNSAPEPYFPYHSIWSLPPILSILYSMNKTPILRKSSDISPQILNEYNIIFLGSIKTLYALKYTLLKSHFRYEISPHKIIYSLPDSNSVRIFETSLHSEGPNEDLVLALKLPGPSNNPIFIIASYHSLGAPEIAYYLTNPGMRGKLLEKFMGKFNRIPKYFEVLFRVSGIDKMAYNTEILIFNEISADNSKKIP